MNTYLDKLKTKIDLKFKDFSKKLIPDTKAKILGVRTPEIKKFAKEFYINSPEKVLTFFNEKHCYFEEFLLHGFLLSNIKDIDQLLLQLNLFVPTIDNWAVCDQTVSALKLLKKHPQKTYSSVKKWLKSDRPYVVRFGIVVLLNYFLDNNFNDTIYTDLSNIKSSHYYVNMAIAWFYSIALIKQYSSAINIIQSKTLPTFVQNKAIQKACESFRITEEIKHQIKNYKI